MNPHIHILYLCRYISYICVELQPLLQPYQEHDTALSGKAWQSLKYIRGMEDVHEARRGRLYT